MDILEERVYVAEGNDHFVHFESNNTDDGSPTISLCLPVHGLVRILPTLSFPDALTNLSPVFLDKLRGNVHC